MHEYPPLVIIMRERIYGPCFASGKAAPPNPHALGDLHVLMFWQQFYVFLATACKSDTVLADTTHQKNKKRHQKKGTAENGPSIKDHSGLVGLLSGSLTLSSRSSLLRPGCKNCHEACNTILYPIGARPRDAKLINKAGSMLAALGA